jgi:hypothetical protein
MCERERDRERRLMTFSGEVIPFMTENQHFVKTIQPSILK